MPSPDKRSSSAPPDNRRPDDDDFSISHYTNKAHSADKSKNKKSISAVIHFLDDSTTVFQISPKALARSLFNHVCEMLNLIEVDYFGLEYVDINGSWYWLDLDKQLFRQLSLSLANPVMYFAVKFYTPDPSRLEDELTRYLFSLQIKKDLSNGLLQCNENTASLLASYIIQAEIGDFNADECFDQSYVTRFKLIPHQDEEFELKVIENHKKHIGQTPAEADFNLLETARRCEMYGMRLTPVKDVEGVPLNLSVAHIGVVVFQNQTKVNTYSWAKIRKLSFKRKKFLIKLHQEEYFGDVAEFFFESRNECKNFWKKCIEQHSFFRCVEVKRYPRQKSKIFSRGSSFRYSGRTQQQVVEYVRQTSLKRQPFQRSNSLRTSTATHNHGLTSSVATQPILPFSTSNLVDSSIHSQFMEGASHLHVERPKSVQEVSTQETEALPCSSENYQYEGRTDLSCVSLNYMQSSQSQIWDKTDTQSQTHSLKRNGNLNSTFDSTFRRPKLAADKEYFIFRELVMSERTFKKDIELINTWFKEDVSRDEKRPSELSLLFTATEPLTEIHQNFLCQIEQTLSAWEGKAILNTSRSIGDILTELIHWLALYERLVERLPFILERINASFRHNRDFEQVCREFEARKGCYLPYTSFILKPAFHITHFCEIIGKLVDYYDSTHVEYDKCRCKSFELDLSCLDLPPLVDVLEQLTHFNTEYSMTLDSLINLVILIELQRDITGMDNVVQSGRRFIREGCLLKLSKRGYQQRLFFLFSDVLIYASRSASSQFHFKVHGNLPLHNIMVEETEPKLGVNHCFTIYAGDRALMVAANSEEERKTWLANLTETAMNMSQVNGNELLPLGQTIMQSNELLDKIDNVLSQRWQKPDSDNEKLQYRSNSMSHVCWHRNCSISAIDYKQALTSCLSGYLLRKFKNSSGWQRLWVVFTNFCLFFYKSYQDDFPLASLPLLGYVLNTPNESDNIHKNYVFKLQFKAHVYFFRTESEYTFNQWMHVISSSTIK